MLLGSAPAVGIEAAADLLRRDGSALALNTGAVGVKLAACLLRGDGSALALDAGTVGINFAAGLVPKTREQTLHLGEEVPRSPGTPSIQRLGRRRSGDQEGRGEEEGRDEAGRGGAGHTSPFEARSGAAFVAGRASPFERLWCPVKEKSLYFDTTYGVWISFLRED